MVDIVSWAQKRPLFTLNDVERFLGRTREYIRLKLHRLTDRGEIFRVERGKYTVYRDPMIYASYIETPSFFSYWTALRYYNLTTQQPSRLHLVTRKNREDLENIQFHSSTSIFGYRKRLYQDFQVFVADRERLFLDCLSKGTVPVEELVDLIQEIDKERIIEYCRFFGKNSVVKRVGYLLEIEGKQMGKLIDLIDPNYVPLDLSKPQQGEKNVRWKIVVNTDVA